MAFQVGARNLQKFGAPLVFQAKFFAVLATSSKFCISEQRLGVQLAFGCSVGRPSETIERGNQRSRLENVF